MKKNDKTKKTEFVIRNGMEIHMKDNGTVGVHMTKKAKSVIIAQALNAGIINSRLNVTVKAENGNIVITCENVLNSESSVQIKDDNVK